MTNSKHTSANGNDYLFTEGDDFIRFYRAVEVRGSFGVKDDKGREIGWVARPSYSEYQDSENRSSSYYSAHYQVTRDGKPFGATWDKAFRKESQMQREWDRRIAKSAERYSK